MTFFALIVGTTIVGLMSDQFLESKGNDIRPGHLVMVMLPYVCMSVVLFVNEAPAIYGSIFLWLSVFLAIGYTRILYKDWKTGNTRNPR